MTEVLGYFHEPWYVDWVCKVGKREANRVSKAAMKVGTRVDELIKACATPAKKDSQEVINCVNAFWKWKEIYKPQSITPCTRLFAVIEGVEVTGEPDLMVDDVLVDIKCSRKISLAYWVQVNMYRYLMNIFISKAPYPHLMPGLTDKIAILRLDKKTGSYEYVVKDYEPKLVDVWCGMLKAYVYLKGEADGDEL